MDFLAAWFRPSLLIWNRNVSLMKNFNGISIFCCWFIFRIRFLFWFDNSKNTKIINCQLLLMFGWALRSTWVETLWSGRDLAFLYSLGNSDGLVGFGYRSNYLDLTARYYFIDILELREDDTAKGCGELDYKHIDTNDEDDRKRFAIVQRLNIEHPIVILMRGKRSMRKILFLLTNVLKDEQKKPELEVGAQPNDFDRHLRKVFRWRFYKEKIRSWINSFWYLFRNWFQFP